MPCPAAVATTNWTLTRKPPESQSAGEGDAPEFKDLLPHAPVLSALRG